MGPPPAEGMLRELMAMGVDEGVLVTAREFGGSDTYATSQILAAAVETYGLGEDDIIFAGRQAIDGRYGSGRTSDGRETGHTSGDICRRNKKRRDKTLTVKRMWKTDI